MSDTTPIDAVPAETRFYARPRVRFGAIAWGLIVCTIAGTVLAISTSARNRAAYAEWLATLTGGTLALGVVLVLGGFSLLIGLLALIRHAQRG